MEGSDPLDFRGARKLTDRENDEMRLDEKYAKLKRRLRVHAYRK